MKKIVKKQTFFVTMLLIMLVWIFTFEPIKYFFYQLINGVQEGVEEAKNQKNTATNQTDIKHVLNTVKNNTVKNVKSNSVNLTTNLTTSVFDINRKRPVVFIK